MLELDRKRRVFEEAEEKRSSAEKKTPEEVEMVDESLKMDCAETIGATNENEDESDERSEADEPDFYTFDTFYELMDIYLTLRNTESASISLKST